MKIRGEPILVIAPHPDDEILGVGGTIAKLADQECDVTVLTISGHLPPLYPVGLYERTIEEARQAHKIVGVSNSVFLGIAATMISDLPIHELNRKILEVVEEVQPTVVLCPYPDRHIDHRLVFDSALVATRPVSIGTKIRILAAYETLSETHWNAPHIEPNFTPNWIVDISEFLDQKKNALMSYASQVTPFPGPRSVEAAVALATLRGTQAGFPHGEGLHLIRMSS
jgi:LmbE family N-acetylglucosaminyl deacetylase